MRLLTPLNQQIAKSLEERYAVLFKEESANGRLRVVGLKNKEAIEKYRVISSREEEEL